MRIHTDNNGVATTAIHTWHDGSNVEGHLYRVEGNGFEVYVKFQEVPARENGVNGLTNEALLAIVKHRIEVLNRAPWTCGENHVALAGIELALTALEKRTAARLMRGVEGTLAP